MNNEIIKRNKVIKKNKNNNFLLQFLNYVKNAIRIFEEKKDREYMNEWFDGCKKSNGYSRF